MIELNKLFQQKIFRRFGTVTFVAAIALLSLAVSVQAAQLTVSESVTASRQGAALAFWTRARIAAAPALALPVDRSGGGIDAAVLYEPEVIGPGSSSPPGAADPNAAQAARAIFWRDWMALEAEDEAALDEPALDEPADEMAGTFGVYTFYDVNRTSAFWNIFPHKWDGKFTFTTPSGGASCSATVISGNNIVTAAHCVYDTPSRNQFYTNKIFTPAYRNGSAPFGTFPTTTCSVLTAWANLSGGFSINTWSRHDVAVCTLGKNALGQTINQAVGWAGRLAGGQYPTGVQQRLPGAKLCRRLYLTTPASTCVLARLRRSSRRPILWVAAASGDVVSAAARGSSTTSRSSCPATSTASTPACLSDSRTSTAQGSTAPISYHCAAPAAADRKSTPPPSRRSAGSGQTAGPAL